MADAVPAEPPAAAPPAAAPTDTPPSAPTSPADGFASSVSKKRKGKKELSPEELAAQAEEERLLVRSFYLRKWTDVKQKTTLFNQWLDEGFPSAEFQSPRTAAELLPIFLGITEEELVPFEKAMAPLLLTPEYWREDVKLYTAAATRYAEWLVQKSAGSGADKLPPLPGAQPPRKGKLEMRSRFVVEFVNATALEVEEKEEGESSVTSTDEVAALNVMQVEWFPIREMRKVEKPKDKSQDGFLLCRNPKCADKYIPKLYAVCGACEQVYCSYNCQKEDWPAHQNTKRCNRTLSKQLRLALRALDQPRLKPHFPYLRLLFATLQKMNPHDGVVWYTMAYLRDADWQKYNSLVPKDKEEGDGKRNGDVFAWSCFTPCYVSRTRAEAVFTKQKDAARTPRLLFEIKCIEGYRFSQYVESTDPTVPIAEERDEVMLPMGAAFRLLSREANGLLLHLVVEQLPAPYPSMPDPRPH